MHERMPTAFLLPLAAVAACGDNNTASNVEPPGEDTTLRTQVLEAGAVALQNKPPVDAINANLDGFHFYNGRMQGQMEAHHYCSLLNEELTQCVIFDGNTADAKIMGVEYILSERLFNSLPEAEKPLWHSHVYAVRSGSLIAPGIPALAEQELMKKLISTYGKTWHTWHTDLEKNLPIGVPQLMMGFTADGQADSTMITERNRRFDLDIEEVKRRRAEIPVPPIAEGADAWQTGNTVQLEDPTGQEVHDTHGAQNSVNQP
jgi:hypothetical protein